MRLSSRQLNRATLARQLLLHRDGYVAGVWRAVDDGIEAAAFHRLADEVWAGLEGEAGALLKLIRERDPKVYGRYHHWWAKLPKAEVRLLGR